MNDILGTFRIGEDIAVALDAVAGEAAAVNEIAAAMKPARVTANRLVLDDAATAVPLVVASRGAAGWTLSLPADTTATLEAGLYGIDARLAFASGTEITETTAFIAFSRAAVS